MAEPAAAGDRLGMVHSLLVKFAPLIGLNAQEAEWFWNQAADTLHDVQVLVHGGKFRDGTEFVGVRTIVPEVQRHGQAIDAILVRVNGQAVDDAHADKPAKKKGASS